jgi:Arc/MetJ-type ribon-helix-helix transcriptional regulator
MSYEFPPDVQQLIQQHLASGAYASADDVLRDAMGALDQRELEKFARWSERNRLAIEQSRAGLSKPLDDARILARLRERLAREGILD